MQVCSPTGLYVPKFPTPVPVCLVLEQVLDALSGSDRSEEVCVWQLENWSETFYESAHRFSNHCNRLFWESECNLQVGMTLKSSQI